MDISEAEYIILDKHPFLRLIIDGKEALIGEFKWNILELGVVPLRSRNPAVNWATILPEIHIQEDFKGYTDNPTIIQMTHDFWRAINAEDFKVGVVPIPK